MHDSQRRDLAVAFEEIVDHVLRGDEQSLVANVEPRSDEAPLALSVVL